MHKAAIMPIKSQLLKLHYIYCFVCIAPKFSWERDVTHPMLTTALVLARRVSEPPMLC